MDNIITEKLRSFEIKLQLKPGVFSMHGVDLGTHLLIDNLEIQDKSLVADLGCGAGVLGIICAKLNPSGHIHLLDDHLRAVELSRVNIELNGIRNAEVYLSDLFSAVEGRTYNHIFSNPPAQMGNDFLEEVVLQSYHHLKGQGYFWVVIPNHLKPVLVRLFEKYFRNYTIVAHGKEHVVLKAQR